MARETLYDIMSAYDVEMLLRSEPPMVPVLRIVHSLLFSHRDMLIANDVQ